MRKLIELCTAALFASLAFGQSVDRVLTFTRVDTAPAFQEIANALRTLTGVQQASVNSQEKTLAVSGDAGQIAAAEWFFYELDRSAGQPPPAAPGEYRLSGVTDKVMQVFYFTHARTQQEIQEVVNTTRTLLDIQRMFPVSGQGAVALRGTEEQIAAADWLFHQLDRATGGQAPAPQAMEYRPPSGGVDSLRVLYLSHGQAQRDLQEMVNAIRTLTDMQRMFPCAAQSALAMRGTDAQVSAAEWLYRELDQPALNSAQPIARDSTREFRMPPLDRVGNNNVLRIFYLTHAQTAQERQSVVNAIRTGTQCQRLFFYSALNAIAMRGTDFQAAEAERLIKQLDDQNVPKAVR